MREQTMSGPKNPDWETLVREQLKGSPRSCVQEVIAELAAHLEEVYEDARAGGSSEIEAMQRALQEVEDWDVLAARIARAKSEEDSMNLNTLNQRTRSLWLPALASLLAASLFLFLLTEISLQPPLLVRLHSGAGQWLYAVWIIGQIAFGALGAFLSRRVGGSRMARIVAGTFPAIVMLAACLVVIPVSALLEHNDFIFHNPGRLWLGAFLWAVVPGVTLLLGAAPFLKESTLRQA
jgi:hypothetical protein